MSVVGGSSVLRVEPSGGQAGGDRFDRTESYSGRLAVSLFDTEVTITKGGVEGAKRFRAKLVAYMGRHPQHSQPCGVTVFVTGGEFRGVVLGLVQNSKTDKAPLDVVVRLRYNLFDPARGDPGERTYGVEEELDIGSRGSRHRPKLSGCATMLVLRKGRQSQRLRLVGTANMQA